MKRISTSALMLIAIATSPMTAAPAHAADMIEYEQAAPTYVARKHRTYAVRTTYVVAPVNCDEILVEYRRPYVPHTEIVRLCDRYRY